MIIPVILAVVLLGGTTWLAQNQAVTRHPTVNRRLAGIGLLCCLAMGVVLVIAAVASL